MLDGFPTENNTLHADPAAAQLCACLYLTCWVISLQRTTPYTYSLLLREWMSVALRPLHLGPYPFDQTPAGICFCPLEYKYLHAM